MPAVPSFSPISRLALAAGTALGLALLWFGVAFHLGALREAALDTARHNAINLARALEEHIARTIEGLDRIMVHVREEYARDPAGFDPRSLADYPLGDPAQGIVVVDAEGRLLGSEARADDRAHFRAHADSADDVLLVSRPMVGRLTGRPSLLLTRRVALRDGSFGGIVAISLDPERLRAFYSSIELGPNSVVGLTGTDGFLRARAGAGSVIADVDLSQSPLMREQALRREGIFHTPTVIDGVERTIAYRTLATVPLIVSVGVADEDALAGYAESRRQVIGGGALLAVIFIAFALLLDRQLARVGRKEAALREGEARYRSVVENISEALFQSDAEGRWTFLNPAWEQITGFGVAESLGRPFHHYLHPDDRERMADQYRRIMRGERSFRRHEARYATSAGGWRWVEVLPKVTRDAQGCVTGASGTLTDVTERHEAASRLLAAKDEAEAASRAKSSFLANMSHELRTPLNAILGFSELIERAIFGPVGSPKYLEYARDIRRSGEHLLALVNQVLDLSKVEAGRYELKEEAFRLSDLVGEALRIAQGHPAAAKLGFCESVMPGLMVRADRLALKQVVLNLVSNAVKFTPPGGIVTVQTRIGADGGAEIIVADSGPGIPEALHEKIFEPFGRGNVETRDRGQSSGLGLPISRALMTLHGGALQLKSATGEGTEVTASFPPSRTLRAA